MLALIVVKALTNSPWGMFTVVSTIPIAVLMGVWMRFVQPGRIGGVSLVGFVLLIVGIVLGGEVAAIRPGRRCSPSPARSLPGS